MRKMVINYQDLLEYLNRLGVVNPSKPTGWRQQDLCAMADRLIACAKGRVFPFYIRFWREYSKGTSALYFSIDGVTYGIPSDMRSTTLTWRVS